MPGTAINAVALHITDPEALAKAQQQCKIVAAHPAGKHPKGLVIKDINFGNTALLSDVSDNKKARPIVPLPWQDSVTTT